MRKVIITLTILLIAINVLSQGQITGVDNIGGNDIREYNCLNKPGRKYFRQFVIPIETNGQSINNGIELTIIANLNLNNNYSIRLLDEANNTGAPLINSPLTINNNQATHNLTFNGNSTSTVYRIIIWNNTTNKEHTFMTNYNGNSIPFEFYIVTERNKTGTFNYSTYNYKISWVDWWVSQLDNNTNYPNTSGNFFLTHAEDALNFNWYWQINQWNLCNGLPGNVPTDNNNEFDLKA
jgi:hypothetical protein